MYTVYPYTFHGFEAPIERQTHAMPCHAQADLLPWLLLCLFKCPPCFLSLSSKSESPEDQFLSASLQFFLGYSFGFPRLSNHLSSRNHPLSMPSQDSHRELCSRMRPALITVILCCDSRRVVRRWCCSGLCGCLGRFQPGRPELDQVFRRQRSRVLVCIQN